MNTSQCQSRNNTPDSMSDVCKDMIHRYRAGNTWSVPSEIHIRKGIFADYKVLADHHYRSGKPAAVTAVYVATHADMRATQRDQTQSIIGIIVVCLPRLSCTLRDVAIGGRYSGIRPADRATMVNREVRIISRVVVDPRYRGLGVAVKLVKHALTNAQTVYTEAIAEMGRVNPFFERAGMRRYERPHRPEQLRMLSVLEELDIPVFTLGSSSRLSEMLSRLPRESQTWFANEIQRWAANSFRMCKRDRYSLTYEKCVDLARHHLGSNCLYYMYRKEMT